LEHVSASPGKTLGGVGQGMKPFELPETNIEKWQRTKGERKKRVPKDVTPQPPPEISRIQLPSEKRQRSSREKGLCRFSHHLGDRRKVGSRSWPACQYSDRTRRRGPKGRGKKLKESGIRGGESCKGEGVGKRDQKLRQKKQEEREAGRVEDLLPSSRRSQELKFYYIG